MGLLSQLGEARLLPAHGLPEPEGGGQGQAALRPCGAGPRGHVSAGRRGPAGTQAMIIIEFIRTQWVQYK